MQQEPTPPVPLIYRVTRWIASASLALFYRRIVAVRSPEASARNGFDPVGSGPVVLAANHPNYIIDALAIATRTRRHVQFVGKGPLLDRWPLLSPFLRRLGVIPIYRMEDMRNGARPTNRDSFEYCADVLDGNGAICMFAEGRSHADPRVRDLRTGTARIVLEAESRRGYRLGVRLIPVGLYFPEEDRFFSDGVVVFGEDLPLDPFLAQHRANPTGAVRTLTLALQDAMRGLTLHVPDPGWTTFVGQMYDLTRWSPTPEVDPALAQLRLRQSITSAIERYRSQQPENAQEFRLRVSHLWHRSEAWRRHRLPERDEVARRRGIIARLRDAAALPLATLGFAYHAPPYLVPKLWAHWLVPSREKKAFVKFLVGVPTFIVWYGVTLRWLARRESDHGRKTLAMAWLGAGPLSGILALRMRAHRRRWLDAFRGVGLKSDLRAGAEIVSQRGELLAEFEPWFERPAEPEPDPAPDPVSWADDS